MSPPRRRTPAHRRRRSTTTRRRPGDGRPAGPPAPTRVPRVAAGSRAAMRSTATPTRSWRARSGRRRRYGPRGFLWRTRAGSSLYMPTVRETSREGVGPYGYVTVVDAYANQNIHRTDYVKVDRQD